MRRPSSANSDSKTPIAGEPSVVTPLVFAACATAISYYGYPFLIAAINWERLFLILFVFFSFGLSFLRVLAQGPFLFPLGSKNLRIPRVISVANLFLFAGLLGFSLGLTARLLIPRPMEISMPVDRVIGLSGILVDDPRAFNDGRGMGSLDLIQAVGEGGLRVTARGKVAVFFPAEAIPSLREFGRGSELYVEGALVPRTPVLGNMATEVLFRASGVFILKPAPTLEQFRTGIRSSVMEKFGIGGTSNNAPAWGALASALLLGIRDNLDSDFTSAFSNAGCAHVLALSGMHLAILSSVIAFMLRLFMGIRPASLIGAVFIIVYIFLAGSQPSLVRAGIMFLLGTLALWGFLKKNPLSILALAFILQIFIQGESGISISFILSYSALVGILWIGKTIHEILRGRVPEILNQGLSASMGAVIATAAICSYYFGVIRFIGIISGLIIMPLSSLFMILAFGALILITLLPILFGPLSFILDLLYRLMELAASMAAKAPGLETPNFVPVLIISLALVALLEFLKIKDRNYRRSIASFAN